jgi:hypothetical protein
VSTFLVWQAAAIREIGANLRRAAVAAVVPDVLAASARALVLGFCEGVPIASLAEQPEAAPEAAAPEARPPTGAGGGHGDVNRDSCDVDSDADDVPPAADASFKSREASFKASGSADGLRDSSGNLRDRKGLKALTSAAGKGLNALGAQLSIVGVAAGAVGDVVAGGVSAVGGIFRHRHQGSGDGSASPGGARGGGGGRCPREQHHIDREQLLVRMCEAWAVQVRVHFLHI